MAELVGTYLGQYQIVEPLAQGGMAAVYRARQRSMERDVAIKVLELSLQDTDEFIRRFEREAKVVASLNHANILKVFDYGQQDNLAYLVMEFLRGGSLADQIDLGPMSLNQISRVLSQIAPALDYAHQKGIIHRDLKPQNIMLDEAQNYFVTDFGIVRLMYEQSNLTREGTIIGTPAYIAPERWRTQATDRRADIYALGVVLYQMLTGKLPFSHHTMSGMMQLHLYEPPPPIVVQRPDLPAGVMDVLVKALAKSPDDRFAWSGDLLRAFNAALATEGKKATRPPRLAEDTTTPLLMKRPTQAEDMPTESALNPTPGGTPAYARSLPPVQRLPESGKRTPVSRPTARIQALRGRAPILLGAGGVAVLVLVLLLMAGRGGGGSQPTLTETTRPTETAQIAAATATDAPPTVAPTIAPTETPPLVAIVPSNTPKASPTERPTDTPPVAPTITEPPSLTPSDVPLVPTLTPTLVPSATESATPTEAPTLTATLVPTETLDPVAQAATQFAAQTTATHAAAESAGLDAAQGAQVIFGPASGQLTHNASGQLVEFTASVVVQDFVAEARFTNPYGENEGTFDYGFFFRDEGTNRQYRLIVRSEKRRWGLFLRDSERESRALVNGAVDGLNVEPGGQNVLRLVVRGGEGWFYVNGAFVAVLDLSAKQVAGGVSVVTGVIDADLIAVKSTGYDGFTVAELR